MYIHKKTASKRLFLQNGCNDDCFNCTYDDCHKPAQECVERNRGVAIGSEIAAIKNRRPSKSTYYSTGRIVLPKGNFHL